MPTEWAEPGAFPVAPGVSRVPLPLPNDSLRAVNIYVIETADGLTLVDGGWAIPEAAEALKRALGELGGAMADIRRILVTHVHRDHYTQAVEIRRQFGARVTLGAGEQPTLKLLGSRHRRPLGTQMQRLRVHGAAALADQIERAIGTSSVAPENWDEPDEWLARARVELPGGRVLEAVPTPGHTAGHLVFHDEAGGLLFAGDHILPTITPSVGFEPVPSPNPLGAFLDSLALVRGRPDARLLPAHGPVAESAHARADELIAHHERRLAATQAAVERGAGTAYEVAGQLTWTRRERRLNELDLFNATLAVFETAAHLDLLVARGRLAMHDDDGHISYALPARS